MVRRHLSLLILLACVFTLVLPLRADGVRIWEADTGLGGITDKAKINAYLDDLKAHSVNGVWIQVELYTDGAVNYKKTTLSKLPTAQKFTTGQWANDDYLSYVIAQAKSRGMKAMIKFHGSNHKAWDQHADWQKVDSKGKPVLWNGTLKNFCVNSPYWGQMFFPMVKEIAQNYDVDGFYLDTCQVAYETDDCCFCSQCKARFQKEVGKALPAKPVDAKNWNDPLVKQHAIKRVEWMNLFFDKYEQVIKETKPSAEVLLNVSGGYNSYKDTVSSRHAAASTTVVTPEPVNTPRMYAVTRNQQLVAAKQQPKGEDELAREEIVAAMNRYGYNQFQTKLMLADGGFKPVVPISRYWFTDDKTGMAPTDVAIKEIESAIGAGAKGWCFFGYLAHAQETGAAKKSAWSDPKFIAYLKDLTTGPRSKWIEDMEPDSHIGIMVDRDAAFWNADYWKRFRNIGRIYSAIQHERKLSVGLVAASEPAAPGFGQTGYKLTKEMLQRYHLVICPGLDWVSTEDLQTLKDYYDAGGKLIFMGPLGKHSKFFGEEATDEVYKLFGVTTTDEGEPSGYLKPRDARHPVFTIPLPFTGPGRTFRYSDKKEDSLSYKVKFSDDYEVWADEYTDSGKRPAMIYTKKSSYNPKVGAIAYVNTDMLGECTPDMLLVLLNMIVIVPSRVDALFPSHFSETASVNGFRSADDMTKYIHVFTPDGETDCYFRLRANPYTYPIKAEMIVNGGAPKSIPIVETDRLPEPGEMTVAPRGNGVLKPGSLPPGFAMLKITYEKREYSDVPAPTTKDRPPFKPR